MKTFLYGILSVAIITYGVSLFLPKVVFEPSVTANPKGALCERATSPGTVCAASSDGVPSDCWSPANMFPNRALMDSETLAKYCAGSQNPVSEVDYGYALSIAIGVIAGLALLYAGQRSEKPSKYLGAIIIVILAIIMWTWTDTSKKPLDESGTHFLTGGHAAIGHYLLLFSLILLTVYFLFRILSLYRNRAQV